MLSLEQRNAKLKKEKWLENLVFGLVGILAIIIIIFHGALKPPIEEIPNACQKVKVYHETAWPWYNHVKCIDGEK
jgi:hypothetical protein